MVINFRKNQTTLKMPFWPLFFWCFYFSGSSLKRKVHSKFVIFIKGEEPGDRSLKADDLLFYWYCWSTGGIVLTGEIFFGYDGS